MVGLFGSLFDFNGDGKLSRGEQAAEFATFAMLMDKANKRGAFAEDEDEDEEIENIRRAFTDAEDEEEKIESIGGAFADTEDADEEIERIREMSMDEEEFKDNLETEGYDADDYDFDE